MPGKGGIRPDQSRRSVPVLMPLQADVHHHVGGARVRQGKALDGQLLGALRTTAMVSKRLLRRGRVPLLDCQPILTCKLSIIIYT